MGINGVLESFFYSTVSEKYLQRYRYFIVFNTIIFIIASYLLGKYGVWGIVTANIISMVSSQILIFFIPIGGSYIELFLLYENEDEECGQFDSILEIFFTKQSLHRLSCICLGVHSILSRNSSKITLQIS